MNYDLITKLAKLANNNPNENEANLAARKVCKLLAEGKFEFVVWPIKKEQQTYQPKQDTYTPPVYKSASNPRPPHRFWEDFFDDRKRNYWDGFGREPRNYDIPKDPPKQEPFKGTSYDYVIYDESPTSNEKRSLKCKICGHFKVTRFRGLADNWECMECRGSAYERKKPPTSSTDGS